MVFLNSPWVWGGLTVAGIAVPVLIHLLSRFRSQPESWAAMELLRRAMVVRARRIRFEDLLLLLLRCLALALAGLAFARPALKSSGASGGGRAGIVLALDASFSMQHKPGLRSRFDLAIERAGGVLSTLSPGDPVTIALLGSRPRVLLRNAAYDPDQVQNVLKSAAAFDEGLNVELCLGELDRLVDETRAASRECYVITDFHAGHWADVSEGARQAMASIRKKGSLFLVPVAARDTENVAITRLALASGVLRKNTMARYVVDVRNAGRVPLSGVPVQLFMDKTAIDQRVIDRIEPGRTESASLFANFDAPGTFVMSARLGEDSLPADNVRYSVAGIRDSVSVLCVDGDPSGTPSKGETDFLAAALSPGGSAGGEGGAAGVRVDTIAAGDLQIGKLAAYNIVVLANVGEVIREQAMALADFVRHGGGLIVFLGDKVNAEQANSRLQDRQGEPILPATLVTAAPAASPEGWRLASDMPDHALTRMLRALPEEQRAGIRVDRYIKAVPAKDASVLLTLAPGGDPLLLERSLGRGKVLLVTTTADRQWTDLPIHPAYLMLVQQAVMHLTRVATETPVTVAEPLTFPLSPEEDARVVTVIDPKGEEITVRVEDVAGGKVAALPHADSAGAYEARVMPGVAGIKAVANVDAAESDIVALQGESLNAVVARLPARLVREGEDIATIVKESRSGRELWRLLLWMALAVLVVESVLARRFVRRMEEVKR